MIWEAVGRLKWGKCFFFFCWAAVVFSDLRTSKLWMCLWINVGWNESTLYLISPNTKPLLLIVHELYISMLGHGTIFLLLPRYFPTFFIADTKRFCFVKKTSPNDDKCKTTASVYDNHISYMHPPLFLSCIPPFFSADSPSLLFCSYSYQHNFAVTLDCHRVRLPGVLFSTINMCFLFRRLLFSAINIPC